MPSISGVAIVSGYSRILAVARSTSQTAFLSMGHWSVTTTSLRKLLKLYLAVFSIYTLQGFSLRIWDFKEVQDVATAAYHLGIDSKWIVISCGENWLLLWLITMQCQSKILRTATPTVNPGWQYSFTLKRLFSFSQAFHAYWGDGNSLLMESTIWELSRVQLLETLFNHGS